MKPALDIDALSRVQALPEQCWERSEGRVTRVIGLTVESAGPLVSVGDLAWIETGNPNVPNQQARIPAEVVGFHERSVILMPIEYAVGIRPGDRVFPAGRMEVPAGPGLLGRVVDGLGRPLDAGPPVRDVCEIDIERAPPPPCKGAG